MQILFELIPILLLLFIFAMLLNPLFWFAMLLFFPLLLLAFIYFISMEVLVISLINIAVVPKQLWNMMKNPSLRKNHALEHATINVLEERYGELKEVGGFAENDGFYIMSSGVPLPPDEVLSAAKEGLLRLKSGESELAIHPRCGTSITITNLLLSVLFVVVLLFGGWFDFMHLILALAAAYLVSKPLGNLAQRYITTDPNVTDMEITGISISPFSRYMGIPIPVPAHRLFIQTRRMARARRIY